MRTRQTITRLRHVVKVIRGLPSKAPWDMGDMECCALGHSSHNPWFKRAGLTWHYFSDEDEGTISHGYNTGRKAAMSFFGINEATYTSLFGWYGACSRGAVAARIEHYIDHVLLMNRWTP